MGRILTRGDQTFLVVVLVIIAGLILWRLAPRSTHSSLQVLHADETSFQLEINSATWVEWMQLEGIGETTARKIVLDREQNGPFASVDDVIRIKGIGPATLSKIRKHLKCAKCSEMVSEAK